MGAFNKKTIFQGILAGGILFFGSFQFSAASSITKNNVINLVNEARLEAGLEALKENYKLNEAALHKLEDMNRNNYFAHTSPQNVSPWYWFDQVGYDYQYAGENLAIDFLSAEEQQSAWMQSAGHRKNILSAQYQEIGVAVSKKEIQGKVLVTTVQLFGTRSNAQLVLGEETGHEGNNLLAGISQNSETKISWIGKIISQVQGKVFSWLGQENNQFSLRVIALFFLAFSVLANLVIISAAYFWNISKWREAAFPKFHWQK